MSNGKKDEKHPVKKATVKRRNTSHSDDDDDDDDDDDGKGKKRVAKKKKTSVKKAKVGKSEDEQRKDAEKWVKEMPIILTGIPVPGPIVGILPTTKDSIIRYTGPTLKPRKWFLDRVKPFDALWARFLQKLTTIPFFQDMTIKEREAWLYADAFEKEMDIVDIAQHFGGVALGHILQSGDKSKSKLAQVDEDLLGEWMADPEPTPLSTIKDAIVDQTGARSLFFLPNFWSLRVINAGQVPENYNGLQITLGVEELELYDRKDSKSNRSYLIAPNLVIVDPYAHQKTPIGNDNEMFKCMIDAWKRVRPATLASSSSAAAAASLTDEEMEQELVTAHKSLKSWLNGLPSSWHKSEMQKLIRYQALLLESPNLDGQRIGTEAALLVVMAELLINPGGLTPNVKRWVTGVEAFYKRLAVILPEDTYVDDPKDLVFLLSCANVSKQVTAWKPAPILVKRAFQLGLLALRERRAMTYNSQSDHPPFLIPKKLAKPSAAAAAAAAVGPSLSGWGLASALLDLVGSMKGDKMMYRDLAVTAKKQASLAEKIPKTSVRPPVMSFLRCIDQHCAASIVYFISQSVLKSFKPSAKSSEPFAPILSALFNQVTGLNPRRTKAIEVTSFGREIGLAQMRFWASSHRTLQPFSLAVAATVEPQPDVFGALELKRELPDAWLAGGVGVLRFKSRPPTLVTLRTNDIDDFVVIRNPSRDVKSKERLTEEEQDAAKELARAALIKGIPWKGCKPPLPEWNNGVIKRVETITKQIPAASSSSAAAAAAADNDDDVKVDYVLKLEGTKSFQPWSKLRHIRVVLPFFAPPPTTVIDVDEKMSAKEEALDLAVNWFALRSDTGVQHASGKLFNAALNSAPEGVLRRVLTHIGGFQSFLTFPRISRGGGPVKGAVSLDDVGAFQLLLAISRWFPSALTYANTRLTNGFNASPTDFAVKTAPLLWELTDRIRAHLTDLTSSMDEKKESGWPALKDTMLVKKKPRQPWVHQIEIVEEFWKRIRAGARGNLLNCPPGMGKTRIVAQYCAEKIEQNVLPEYLIYTMPYEAMKTVLDEWLAYGATVYVLDPHKTSKLRHNPDFTDYILPLGSSPRPFTVTLIEHNSLRDLKSELSPAIVTHSMFVLDEAHKALNDSQRTQMALELSSLAKEFLCMTGTFAIDNKFEKLVPWLSQISPIPVDRKNFWVSLNGMVARRLDTGIPVRRENIVVALTASEAKIFKDNMPFGLGGNNPVADHSSVKRGVIITERACTRGVANKAVEILADVKVPGVMIVAKNDTHAVELKAMLLEEKSIKSKQILILGTDVDTINMTASNVKTDHTHVRVVIVPIRFSTGYNLSRFNIMISMVIASNAATRSQLEGRVNRIGQEAEEILYIVILDSTGFWAGILETHEYPRRLNDILAFALAKLVDLTSISNKRTGGLNHTARLLPGTRYLPLPRLFNRLTRVGFRHNYKPIHRQIKHNPFHSLINVYSSH